MKLNKINQLLKKYDKKYWKLQNQIHKIYDLHHDIYKINGKEKVKVLRHIQTQYLKKAEINFERRRKIQAHNNYALSWYLENIDYLNCD